MPCLAHVDALSSSKAGLYTCIYPSGLSVSDQFNWLITNHKLAWLDSKTGVHQLEATPDPVQAAKIMIFVWAVGYRVMSASAPCSANLLSGAGFGEAVETELVERAC